MSGFERCNPLRELGLDAASAAKPANSVNSCPDPNDELATLVALEAGPQILIDADPAPQAQGQRTTRSAVETGLPDEWIDGLEQLYAMSLPGSFPRTRWLTLIDDARMFARSWGAVAWDSGWSTLEIFGVHPTRPLARVDAAGVVRLLDGAGVISVQQDRIVIGTARNATLSYYRCPRLHSLSVPLWCLGSAGPTLMGSGI